MSSLISGDPIPQVLVRPKKQGTFLARHPWVLDRSILPCDPAPPAGAVVDLVAPEGRWLARGIYNPDSRIRVRLYSWRKDEQLDEPFFRNRFDAAIALRRELGLLDPASATRLVFSEGDGLSGLIVDKYAEHFVVQITALAFEQRLPLVLTWLVEQFNPKSIMVRIDPRVAEAEKLSIREQCVHGHRPTEPVLIEQHGVRQWIDLAEGQKTGHYLDQRENRLQAAQLCHGKRVLDVCCYTGGFGLACAKVGGAAEVVGIDSSQWAIDWAKKHAQENHVKNAHYEVGDCFSTLDRLVRDGQQFGLVILDPPRFASSRRTIPDALRAYHRLNRQAVECLQPGGYLVTCSCSGLVVREDFARMISGVAQKTGRDIQILQQRGASPDHPVSATCPQTDYLKCFLCRVL
jgi:23S rRNA (cytosine1962-C5)-methyltransferase